MSEKIIKALIIEDSEDDFVLMLRELNKSSYKIIHKLVEDSTGLEAALTEEWDVIISDYSLPGFNGNEALRICKQKDIDIPFIIVSGTVGEEIAVEMMKAGAKDYIMKDNLSRLFPAIEREITDAKIRRERKWADLEIKELLITVEKEKNRLSALINSINDEVWFADTNKKFMIANPSALKNFCIDTSENVEVEKLAKSLVVLRADKSIRPVEEAPPLRALAGESVYNVEEIVQIPATGEFRNRQVSSSPVRDYDGKIIGSVSIVRDITERIRAEEELKQQFQELKEWYDVSINREERIIELKNEVNSLLKSSGRKEKYVLEK